MTDAAIKQHIAAHGLPTTRGYCGGWGSPITVTCGRCRGDFLADQQWADEMIRKDSLEVTEIEALRKMGLDVPEIHYQVVEVAGGWSYRWSGTSRLEVGDRVLLPGTGGYFRPYPWEADVVRLDSDYAGEMKDILRVTMRVTAG